MIKVKAYVTWQIDTNQEASTVWNIYSYILFGGRLQNLPLAFLFTVRKSACLVRQSLDGKMQRTCNKSCTSEHDGNID
jgi:hypothetical protein